VAKAYFFQNPFGVAGVSKIRFCYKMMSVNLILVYHTLLKAYNIMRHSSSEQIHKKWTNIGEKKYSLRNITNNDLKVPEKPKFGFYIQWSKIV
jgi:hypothetical protein